MNGKFSQMDICWVFWYPTSAHRYARTDGRTDNGAKNNMSPNFMGGDIIHKRFNLNSILKIYLHEEIGYHNFLMIYQLKLLLFANIFK